MRAGRITWSRARIGWGRDARFVPSLVALAGSGADGARGCGVPSVGADRGTCEEWMEEIFGLGGGRWHRLTTGRMLGLSGRVTSGVGRQPARTPRHHVVWHDAMGHSDHAPHMGCDAVAHEDSVFEASLR